MSTVSVPSGPTRTVQTGRFWAGAVATAVVAALVGVVGVLVFEQVLSVNLIAEPNFFPHSDMGTYALAGALLALVGALLAYLLILASPRPMAFFGWIMALISVVVAVLPLSWTANLTVALCTGALNLLVCVCVWTLTVQVAHRTVTRVWPSTIVPGVPDAPGVRPASAPTYEVPSSEIPRPEAPRPEAPGYVAPGSATPGETYPPHTPGAVS